MFVPSNDMITLTLGAQNFFTDHFNLLIVLDQKFITFSYFHDVLFTITSVFIYSFYSVYLFIHLTNIYYAR